METDVLDQGGETEAWQAISSKFWPPADGLLHLGGVAARFVGLDLLLESGWGLVICLLGPWYHPELDFCRNVQNIKFPWWAQGMLLPAQGPVHSSCWSH